MIAREPGLVQAEKGSFLLDAIQPTYFALRILIANAFAQCPLANFVAKDV
jgi:hypothetical protein